MRPVPILLCLTALLAGIAVSDDADDVPADPFANHPRTELRNPIRRFEWLTTVAPSTLVWAADEAFLSGDWEAFEVWAAYLRKGEKPWERSLPEPGPDPRQSPHGRFFKALRDGDAKERDAFLAFLVAGRRAHAGRCGAKSSTLPAAGPAERRLLLAYLAAFEKPREDDAPVEAHRRHLRHREPDDLVLGLARDLGIVLAEPESQPAPSLPGTRWERALDLTAALDRGRGRVLVQGSTLTALVDDTLLALDVRSGDLLFRSDLKPWGSDTFAPAPGGRGELFLPALAPFGAIVAYWLDAATGEVLRAQVVHVPGRPTEATALEDGAYVLLANRGPMRSQRGYFPGAFGSALTPEGCMVGGGRFVALVEASGVEVYDIVRGGDALGRIEGPVRPATAAMVGQVLLVGAAPGSTLAIDLAAFPATRTLELDPVEAPRVAGDRVFVRSERALAVLRATDLAVETRISLPEGLRQWAVRPGVVCFLTPAGLIEHRIGDGPRVLLGETDAARVTHLVGCTEAGVLVQVREGESYRLALLPSP